MPDREAILAALPPGSASQSLAVGANPRPETSDHRQPADLWQSFASRLEALGGKMISLEEVPALLDGKIYVDKDAEVLATHTSNAEIWDAEIGVTLAEWAVAETGSLLLCAGPERARLASLAPPIHICFVRNDRIVATLEEALAELTDRTSVLITGPSRTADIEGVLVRGVHGPKQIFVVRV